MKVIFLDWDGVLNSDMWSNRFNDEDYAPVMARYGYREKYLEQADSLMDRNNVLLLDRIVRATGAKIVLSTSHRKHTSLTRACRMLRHRGLSERCVIGATPDLRHAPRTEEFHRGLEIAKWLEWVGGVESYVILDDDRDMGELSDRLIQTDPEFGLESRDADRAIEMLGGVVEP